MGKNSHSRSANFARNSVFAMLSELSAAILAFAVRLFFVRCLNAEYLGIGGLFTNILTILSLAELGAGSAIVYSMYKPLAENDTEKIRSLLGLYKKFYLCIGSVILILGLCLIPFLDFFINERPNIPYSEFMLIYVLTVIQTATSYFFSYKYSIFSANQQGYIIKWWGIVFSAIKSAVQICVLVLAKNYVLYVLIGIIASLGQNVVLTISAEKRYSYLKGKAEKLDHDSVSVIKKNTFALLLYKLGTVIATTIDTLIISKFFGLIAVGIYSNYHLIISYSDKFFSSVLGTITPSLGNLMVTGDEKKKNQVFSALQLVYYWLATYLAVGLLVLFNPFIRTMFGENYLFSQPIVIAIVVSITLTNFQRPCSLTRDATGLFWHGKLRPLVMSVLNVVFSLILIKIYGIIGVVIGTALAKLCTYVWYDPYIVFKYAIRGNLKMYYLNYIAHWGLLAVLAVACGRIYACMNMNGIPGILLGGVMVTIIVNGVYLLLYMRSKSFKYIIDLIKPFFYKISKARSTSC